MSVVKSNQQSVSLFRQRPSTWISHKTWFLFPCFPVSLFYAASYVPLASLCRLFPLPLCPAGLRLTAVLCCPAVAPPPLCCFLFYFAQPDMPCARCLRPLCGIRLARVLRQPSAPYADSLADGRLLTCRLIALGNELDFRPVDCDATPISLFVCEANSV